MWKKSVLGLAILVAGLLVWSCGDGSVDSLSDNEVMMISRFPSTIDYEMLDSIVNACKKDKECWEKAQKTGEIYKGDYTTILRDSSGNIIYKEGDSTFIYDKEGRKLPVFVLSSNSAGDGDEDVTSSGSNTTSGSSSRRSSASGAGYDDDGFIDDWDGGSNGSGSGKSSRQYASTSSSSKKTGSSSSFDMSVLNPSSSSVKVASSGNINIDLGSSSSKINIVASSVSRSSSSATVVVLSSSSVTQHGGGGGGGGNTGTACAANTVLSGTCKVSPSPGVKNKKVTYTFKPDNSNTCSAPDNVEWFVNSTTDGASRTYLDTSYASAQTEYKFDVTYSLAGDKKSVLFSMGGKNVVCDAVTIKADCNTNNSYTCTVKLNSASNNLTKSNPVSYTWTLTKGGCYDVTSVSWSGAVSGSNVYTVTKGFSSASTYSESISVVDESSSTPKSVSCPSALVRNVTETKPTCSVDGKVWATGASLTVKPKSISGCDYDDDKCGYVLKKTGGSNIASSSSGYSGGSLSIAGESSADTVNYTLTLKNKIGSGSCTFNVVYKEPTLDTVSTAYKSFGEGIYRVTIGGSEVRNGFGCTVSGNASSDIIGVFNGQNIQSGSWGNLGTKVPVTLNSSYVFILYANPPSGLKCGIGW